MRLHASSTAVQMNIYQHLNWTPKGCQDLIQITYLFISGVVLIFTIIDFQPWHMNCKLYFHNQLSSYYLCKQPKLLGGDPTRRFRSFMSTRQYPVIYGRSWCGRKWFTDLETGPVRLTFTILCGHWLLSEKCEWSQISMLLFGVASDV